MKISKLACRMVWIIAAISLSTILQSCTEDDEYMNITYNYCCSSDLLDFVTPTIHYTDEKGVEQVVVLKKDMFKEVNKGKNEVTLIINGNDIKVEKDFTTNQWSFSKRYEGWAATDKITVEFVVAEDAPEIIANKEYTFYHGLYGYDVSIYDTDGNLVNIYSKDFGVTEYVVSGSDAKSYLQLMPITTENISIDIKASQES